MKRQFCCRVIIRAFFVMIMICSQIIIVAQVVVAQEISTTGQSKYSSKANLKAANKATKAERPSYLDIINHDSKKFKQNNKSYVVVNNVYAASKDDLEKTKKGIVAQQKDSMAPYNTEAAQGIAESKIKSIDDRVLAEKGNFVVMLKQQNNADGAGIAQQDATVSGPSQSAVEVSSIDRVVLLNTKNDRFAFLSNNILAGVESKEQAELLASKYSLSLIKTIGKGKHMMAIYQAAIDSVLDTVNSMRAEESLRFVEADIVENFYTSH